MPDDNEFAARLTAIERDVAAARELASGAYEDVAQVQLALSAQFRVLNALRETQLDHGARLDSLEARFDGLEGRFDGLEGRFEGLEGRFDGLQSEMRDGFSVLNVGMAQITAMLTTLIGDAGHNGPASAN